MAVAGDDCLRPIGWEKIVDSFADDLTPADTEPFFPLLVDDFETSVGVLERDAHRRVIGHGAERLLGLAECFLRPLAFGDVGDDRADGRGQPVGAHDGEFMQNEVPGDPVRVGRAVFVFDG